MPLLRSACPVPSPSCLFTSWGVFTSLSAPRVIARSPPTAVPLAIRVHRPFGLLIGPWCGAGDLARCVRAALGPDEALADAVRGAVDLPAHAHHPGAARVLEVHGEVIVDVPILRVGALLPPARTDRLHRVG